MILVNHRAYGDPDAQQAQMIWKRFTPLARRKRDAAGKAATEENQSSFYANAVDAGSHFPQASIAVLVVIWQGLQHLLLKTTQHHYEPYSRYCGATSAEYRVPRRNEWVNLAAGLHEMQHPGDYRRCRARQYDSIYNRRR